jgi:hypothetical protein
MSRLSLKFGAVLVLCLAWLSLHRLGYAAGQTGDLDGAIVDSATTDADYQLVGEYAGAVSQPNGSSGRYGLQTVALGDGQFGGMLYEGGLPGSGWNRVGRWPVEGRRRDNQLRLACDEYELAIEGIDATVRSGSGTELGRLRKVIRRSATLGYPPPECSIVLFDGHGTAAFRNAKLNQDGLMQAGTELLPQFRDFTMHLEFRIPYLPRNKSQARGNSGIYINSRYEIQILDSFGLAGAANECGGIYRYRAPDQNMTLPPLAWQTYDIAFRSPRYDARGTKIQNARVTVLHNNVLIHDNAEIENKTGAGQPEGPKLLPIKFQEHGSPVHFRNIWIIDHDRPVRCGDCRPLPEGTSLTSWGSVPAPAFCSCLR